MGMFDFEEDLIPLIQSATGNDRILANSYIKNSNIIYFHPLPT